MPPRACFEIGSYYHLYNRGNNYQDIFFCRDNYLHFLRLLRRHLVEQSIDLLAYCLMPNHYHLLIQSQTLDVSSRMRSLSLAYTKAINRRHGRVGSLFQGRFQSICVE
ncbi:MAG: transposase, partial [Leptolyngbya sp. DLM2.Bin15]